MTAASKAPRKATPPDPAKDQARLQAKLAEALECLGKGRHTAAAEALAAAKRLAPEHPQVHFLLAELAIARDDRKAAIGHATAALGWERKRAEPFLLLGRLLHLEGNSPLAAKLLERALEFSPGSLPVQLALREVRARPRADTTHPELEMLGRKPTIALAMIVKDEEKSIARCLRSARRHVDELIVVDTGSTDATVAIAATLGARVEHFTWIHDFAAARNHALECATTDWVLVLDADEELEIAPGTLQTLVESLPWPAYTGVVPLTSVMLYNHGGSIVSREVWEAMPIPRVFPRQALRYKGAAHETPEPLEGTPHALKAYNAFNVELHHHGYRPEIMRGRDKLTRNIALLRQRLADHPDDIGVYYLMGRELVFNDEFEEGLKALEHYEHNIPKAQTHQLFRLTPYLQAIALGKLGREDEALARLERALAFDPDFPSYHFLKGEKLMKQERFVEAIAAYDLALANGDYRDRHPVANYNSVVPGHGGTLARQRRERAIAMRDGVSLACDVERPADQVALADALAALAEGRLDDAESLLDLAAGLAPTHPQVPYLRAELLLRRGEIVPALQEAFRSLQLDDSVAEPWALAGYLLHEDEDSPLAAVFLERATLLAPDYESATRLLKQVRACPRTTFYHTEITRWLATRPRPAPVQALGPPQLRRL